MGEGPVITLERHIDKRGLRAQQAYLLTIAALMLGVGAMAEHYYGLTSIYAVIALGGGVAFAAFAVIYGLYVANALKDTHYAIFPNRIEYQKSGQVLRVIPIGEIGDISEERTPSQKNAGLTTVVLEVRQGSYLREEDNIEFFVLADVKAEAMPSDIIYELMKAYNSNTSERQPGATKRLS